MKRLILATLSVLALSTVATPTLALSDRFESARQQTMNKLNDRFDKEHQETLNKLNDRFDKSNRGQFTFV